MQFKDTQIKIAQWKNFTLKIQFWIILFFIVRLFGITQPPLEVAHNWRQTTVTMVARNFLEIDSSLFFPRIDIAGNLSGITGMEFPLLNYLIYIVSLMFGYEHWYGRLINLIVSSFGLFYFYKLVLIYFKEKVAFSSTIVLLFSIWFAYSRKIMPDTFSMSFIITGLYCGVTYIRGKGRLNYLLYYLVLISLGILTKLPSGYCLILLLLFFFNYQENKNQLNKLIVFTGVVLILPAVWYFYWVPHLVEKFGFWHFYMGNGFIEGFFEIINNMQQTTKKFYDSALKYSGFGVFLIGLLYAIKNNNYLIISIFCLSFVGFLVVVIKAGFAFSHHDYYIIPFVPIMALVCGYAISCISYSKLGLVLLIGISVEGILNQQHDFFIKHASLQLLNLENDLDKISSRTDLVLINSTENPAPMYFSHRKGWVASNDQITNINFIDSLKTRGLKNIIILNKALGKETNLKYPILLENADYTIYSLD